MKFYSLDEILEKAITKEQEAYELYHRMQKLVQDEGAKNLLQKLAHQESEHKKILEKVKEEDLGGGQSGTLSPMAEKDRQGISDYLIAKPISEKTGLQDVVVLAIKREEKAEQFYSTMKEAAQNEELQSLFEKLSRWEHEHKTLLEQTFWDITYGFKQS